MKLRMIHLFYDTFGIKRNKKAFYFILDSENQCISKLDKIGIFTDMKFH